MGRLHCLLLLCNYMVNIDNQPELSPANCHQIITKTIYFQDVYVAYRWVINQLFLTIVSWSLPAGHRCIAKSLGEQLPTLCVHRRHRTRPERTRRRGGKRFQTWKPRCEKIRYFQIFFQDFWYVYIMCSCLYNEFVSWFEFICRNNIVTYSDKLLIET